MPDPDPTQRLTDALIAWADAVDAGRLAATPAKRTEGLTAAARQIIAALHAWLDDGDWLDGESA